MNRPEITELLFDGHFFVPRCRADLRLSHQFLPPGEGGSSKNHSSLKLLELMQLETFMSEERTEIRRMIGARIMITMMTHSCRILHKIRCSDGEVKDRWGWRTYPTQAVRKGAPASYSAGASFFAAHIASGRGVARLILGQECMLDHPRMIERKCHILSHHAVGFFSYPIRAFIWPRDSQNLHSGV